MKKLSKCLRKQDSEPTEERMNIGYEVDYRNVQNARIELKPSQDIQLILPHGTENPERFIEDKSDWIKGKISYINSVISKLKVEEREVEKKFLLFGNLYSIEEVEGGREIQLDGDVLTISAPKDTNNGEYLASWIKERFRDKISFVIKLFSDRLGLEHNKIYIRRQRTKWASCSSKANLSFNLKAAALPDELLHYLVLHELVHLKIENHEEEFWRNIARTYPDYKEKEESLMGYWFLVHKNELWNEILQK